MQAKKRQRRLWKPSSDEEDGVLSAGYARIESHVADSLRSQRSVGPFGKRQSHWLLAADNDRTAVPLVLRFRCTQRPFRVGRRSTQLQAHRQCANKRRSGCEWRISERLCKY
jgi:hypothetical protein